MKKTVKKPLKAGILLLHLILNNSDKYGFLGDIEEMYNIVSGKKGRFRAEIWFWKQIILFLPSALMDKIHWGAVMFKNYLKISFRNIKRQKIYSVINLSGLSIGITCFLLIFLYVQYELSFDRFHPDCERIYRVNNHDKDLNDFWAFTQAPLASALMSEYPDVEFSTSLRPPDMGIFEIKNSKYFETGIYADNQFFNVFDFRMLKGEKVSSLSEPNTVVLSEKLAVKYYGGSDPVGKTITFNGNCELKVTGIYENIPGNSHLRFDYIISMPTYFLVNNNDPNDWEGSLYLTYLLLKKNVIPEGLESKLSGIVNKYININNNFMNTAYCLQPLRDIHLKSQVKGEVSGRNDIKNIYRLSLIAIIILSIACINYMNLSTARSTIRAKEIGVRKITGAGQGQLVRQFLSESILYSFISLFAALLITRLVLPYYNSFISRDLKMIFFDNPVFAAGTVILVLFVGIISGSYPALLLSSISPVKILKGTFRDGGRGAGLRNTLVVFQFCISIFLIVGTITVFSQLNYIKNRDPGYNREHVISISLTDPVLRKEIPSIKKNLLLSPDISAVTVSSSLPLNIGSSTDAKVESGYGSQKRLRSYYTNIDYDYLSLFEIELAAGRNFSREFLSDREKAVIVNETAVRKMGLKNPVGKKFAISNIKDGRIIGVVKNFNFLSCHNRIEPLTFLLNPDKGRRIIVKVNPKKVNTTISFMKETIEKYESAFPFTYSFMDERFNNMYKPEQRLGTIIGYFSLLAIFIACLGIFGLVSFTAETKTKEIGIRKSLGASAAGLTLMLCRKFAIYVLAANIIALPAAFFVMDSWLENFAYRINIGTGILAGSALIAFFIALFSVIFQAVKAASANPVKSLRYE